jgi:serine/threonine protein kinase/Tol biopolymer transport system component
MSVPDWAEVERALADALELEGQERATYLKRLPASVRSEVESLLAADNRAHSFLKSGSLEPSAEPGSTLAVGSLLGQYRIDAPIGQGGMGRVYRAHDSKLNRTVAVKVLSEQFADAAARRRFQREAQLASSLNHPHIVTVYDVGEFEGRQYLVTEFIDGGTLQDWAGNTPRSWREVVELLAGVADSLATAHDAKILHRDIKPANILITKTGYAKLADFGLAKLNEHMLPAGSDEKTRTAGDEITRPGMIVGTVAYMSPELVTAKVTDARSDIFSFGVVLYELLCRRRPFTGTTDVDVLHAIVHDTPAPVPEEVPPALRTIVEKALEKDPGERYQSMREMVVDLRRLLRRSSAEIDAPQLRSAKTKWIPVLAALLLVLVAATAWVLIRSPQPAERTAVQYTQLTNFADSATSPALSPDGRMLTFIRGPETFTGPGEIYVKLLPDGEPVQLTHDGFNKMSPVFDADGTHIAYTIFPGMRTHGETWSIPVLGGQPSRMLTNAEALSFVKNTTGPPRVLFSEWGEGVHLSVITATPNRSDARTVYAPPSMVAMAHRSYLSPDHNQVLVVEMDGGWRPCRVVPFEASVPAKIVGPSLAQCTSAAWSPDSQWMYFSANTGNGYHIWRQKFPNGEPEQVTFGATEEEGISFAPDGRSFVTSVGTRQSTLWVHTAQGDRQITSQGFASLPQISADGKKVYYLLRSKSNRRFVSGELWTADLETGRQERLLSDFVMEHYNVSADGNRIVFAAIDDMGHSPVWFATLDGSAPPKRLASIDAVRTFFGVNGDIYFLGAENETTRFIYRVKEDGSGLQKTLQNPVSYFFDVSPDAKSLAVHEGDAVKVYPADGGPAAFTCIGCGAAGGENRGVTPPAVSWSRDGKFLYLNDRDAREIYAVPLPPGRTLPPIPAADLGKIANAATGPDVVRIKESRAFGGANPSIYAFPRLTTQRNIYRISVP